MADSHELYLTLPSTGTQWAWLNGQREDVTEDEKKTLNWPLRVGDFWQRTFYQPLLQKTNADAIVYPASSHSCRVEASFQLEAVNQFDQAGVLVYLDQDHWIKAGIELADGQFRLSTVVTNTHSDWSTQVVANASASIRLQRLRATDYVVEARSDATRPWEFIRICHLATPADLIVKMGVYACAPTAPGGSVQFTEAKWVNATQFDHSN